MKLRREFKIGIFAVIVILVSWWGIKWLGSQNLLKRTQTYYVYFDDVPGINNANKSQFHFSIGGSID